MANFKPELYDEHLKRLMDTVALKKTDRPPVCIINDMFAPIHMGVKMADFVSDFELANKTMIDSILAIDEELDAVQMPVNYPDILSTLYYARVKLPGRDLPDDALWQIDERELITVDDYDFIIENGWAEFTGKFFEEYMPGLFESLIPFFGYGGQAVKNMADQGIVAFTPLAYGAIFEAFCGGRTMARFMRDLYRMPDKVEAAMDAAMPEFLGGIEMAIEASQPLGSWVGGWRTASEFLSPKLWERFFWKYYKPIVELVAEKGVTPVLHMDSNWERDLEYFRELPKGKCVFAPDGMTNIYKIKEVLGDMMAIMGDVPPAMLALGTPDEVHNYSRKLIKDMGDGYILAMGCDIPANAKPENVKAMIAAAKG